MNIIATTVEGSLRNTLTITWTNTDDTALNLTNATITGTIKPANGNAERAITGTLTITVQASGIFTWEPSAADVATPGNYIVTFTATFSVGATPAVSKRAVWVVAPSN